MQMNHIFISLIVSSPLFHTTLSLPLKSTSAVFPSELSSFTECAKTGFKDWASLTPYLQRLDVSSPYGKTSASQVFLPLFSSLPLTGLAPNNTITTLAIYLHGLSGAANTYFCDGLATSAGHNALVIAPWFGNEQVDGQFWNTPNGDYDDSYSTFWTTSRWLTGGNISPGPTGSPSSQYTTSFDVMEALLLNLTTSGLFPNLKLVSLNGFSAGSQFFGRFMWGSPVGGTSTQDAAMTGGIETRFLISDPGTYLYMTDQRPADECRPLFDTGADWTCDKWEIPAEAEVCLDYDEYKYGISPGTFSSLNAYMAIYDTNTTAREEATQRMSEKNLIFIFGENDNCNCNTQKFELSPYCFPDEGALSCLPNAYGGAGCCDTFPDATTSNAMDVKCQAMVQGSNRLQRGLLYVSHLNYVFPGRTKGPFTATVVKGMGHDNAAEYKSAAFQQAAFYE